MERFKTLKDHVYDFIAEEIREGKLLPGQRISENDICNELEISRTPVREALIQLAAEGIIENTSRKGFTIKTITVKEITELYTVIGALDATAAKLACNNLTKQDYADMSFYIESIDLAIKSENFEMYHKQQIAFHQIYIQKCGNKTLIDFIETAKNKLISKIYTDTAEGNAVEVLLAINEEHREILKFLKAKDEEGVFKYIAERHWVPIYTNADIIL
ncbi:MAG: GntR family transcriptional regulator [Firmicutes bacterium]|jgi:DNA-binding GntR family transcriptional regulator|nr:GntR family transcriptional regulator [Bacillota bacterium]